MEVQSLRYCFGIGFVPPALPGVNEIPAPLGRAGDVSSGVREMREMREMRGVRGIRCGGVWGLAGWRFFCNFAEIINCKS